MTAPTHAVKRIEFPGSQGEALAGRLELPTGEPRAFALFAHCFTCGKDAVAATRISRALTSAGIAVLRFDFTGLGQSGGDFANTNFSSNVEDLVRAADFLRSEGHAPTLLIGHSLGGTAVAAAAAQIAEVLAVVTIAAPADPGHVTALMRNDLDSIEESGEAEVDLGGRPFRIRRQFLRDLEEHDLPERIAQLDAALLVLHSPVDAIVPVDNARRIYEAARHPKSFVALDGADHLLLRAPDAVFAASIIGAWVQRYLPDAPPDAEPPDAEPSEAGQQIAEPSQAPSAGGLASLESGEVRVSENGDGPYGQTVSTTRHELRADEPSPIGHDSGMSPYELLLAGLGSCTSMTIRMYAERKKWSLEHVEVTLSHSRVHADDCVDCETKPANVEHIDRSIVVRGDLDPEQLASIEAIADKCPVHRTLHANVHIGTKITRHTSVSRQGST